MEEISRSLRSKTFWEIKDEISFSNAKVHFSGHGDFEIDDMDRGIQMEWLDERDCDGMCVDVIGVNILTDWCVLGESEGGADKVVLWIGIMLWSDERGVAREGASVIDDRSLGNVLWNDVVISVGEGDEVIEKSVIAVGSEIGEMGYEIDSCCNAIFIGSGWGSESEASLSSRSAEKHE